MLQHHVASMPKISALPKDGTISSVLSRWRVNIPKPAKTMPRKGNPGLPA